MVGCVSHWYPPGDIELSSVQDTRPLFYTQVSILSMSTAIVLLQGRYKDSEQEEEKRYIAKILGVSIQEYVKAQSETFEELIRPYRECEKGLLRTIEEEWNRKMNKWRYLKSAFDLRRVCIVCEHLYYRSDDFGDSLNSAVAKCGRGWEYIIDFDPEIAYTEYEMFGIVTAIKDRKKRMEEKVNKQYTVILTNEIAQELSILIFTYPVHMSAEEYISKLIHDAWHEQERKMM